MIGIYRKAFRSEYLLRKMKDADDAEEFKIAAEKLLDQRGMEGELSVEDRKSVQEKLGLDLTLTEFEKLKRQKEFFSIKKGIINGVERIQICSGNVPQSASDQNYEAYKKLTDSFGSILKIGDGKNVGKKAIFLPKTIAILALKKGIPLIRANSKDTKKREDPQITLERIDEIYKKFEKEREKKFRQIHGEDKHFQEKYCFDWKEVRKVFEVICEKEFQEIDEVLRQ